MKLRVGNIEEVSCADDLLGGDAHQSDLGRVAADLGCPVTKQLLVRLDVGSLGVCGRPLKVSDPFDLDGHFVRRGLSQ